ncbi:SsrA-binding protein SmpB [candidate division KSB1 bacterium]|nr:MAG: SsrA-binding protein SmpB [candidate division KSB1 bacterium]
MQEKGPSKVVAKNRKAWHEYHLLQRYEAGISLLGTEVKSVRAGHVGLQDAYAAFEGNELYLYNVTIGAYRDRGYAEHEERRRRKLLLHRDELRKLARLVEEKGNTLIPLQLYFSGAHLKAEIAVARGKKEYDKRRQKEEARVAREVDRELKQRLKRG